MGHSLRLTSFNYLLGDGLLIMSLYRRATLSQMVKPKNAVRTVKRLFEKYKEAGLSEFQALLDWRDTPPEGMDTSLAQRLMGRRCRTLLPMSESLYNQVTHCLVICVRWHKGKIARYCSMEIYYDLLWFI